MINVEVQKNAAENTASIIRRFTKKVQESGVLPKVRSLRYSKRNESSYVRKKKTLKKLRHREAAAMEFKLGYVPQEKNR